MKMALDNPGGANFVAGYTPGEVRIRDKTYGNSLILLPDRLLEDWAPSDASQLRSKDFSSLLDAGPEVLILGTGERQVFPEPAVFATLMDLGVGFEVMDNGAACRTYNILLGEGRRVALALLFPMA